MAESGVRRVQRLPVEKRRPNRGRDILFMSRVADPERCHVLSGNARDQRFNVAASRARARRTDARLAPHQRLAVVEHLELPAWTAPASRLPRHNRRKRPLPLRDPFHH